MKNEKLDIDGLHGLIIMLQRCPDEMASIHLSNLGIVNLNFAHKKWYKEFIQEINYDPKAYLNHQAPNIPFFSEWHQNDPTFQMFTSLIKIQMESDL